ncbi:MAG: hypothetical protein AB8I69_13210 [Anaerolineae bacterium]
MEIQTDSHTNKEPPTMPPASPQEAPAARELSPAELKAKRLFIIFAVVAGLLLIGLVVLLVFLSIDAYHAAYTGAAPSPGSVVVGLLRDVAIVFVAFETMIIGILLIVLRGLAAGNQLAGCQRLGEEIRQLADGRGGGRGRGGKATAI